MWIYEFKLYQIDFLKYDLLEHVALYINGIVSEFKWFIILVGNGVKWQNVNLKVRWLN